MGEAEENQEAEKQEELEEPKALVDILRNKGTVDFSLEEKASELSASSVFGSDPLHYHLIATYHLENEEEKEERPFVVAIPCGEKLSDLGLMSWRRKGNYESLIKNLIPGTNLSEITTYQLDIIFGTLSERLTELTQAGITTGKVGAYETFEAFKEAYAKVAPKKS